MLVTITLVIAIFTSGFFIGKYLHRCDRYVDVAKPMTRKEICDRCGHSIFELITHRLVPGTNKVSKFKQHHRSCVCGITETGESGPDGNNDQFEILTGAVARRP